MKKSLAIYYDMVISKEEKKIKIFKKRPCKSFVKQFCEILLIGFSSMRNQTMVDTSNTSRAFLSGDGPFVESELLWNTGLFAGVGVTSYGPLLGSGVTAVTINDYDMETLIAHGTGAGELQYSATTFGAPSTDATGSTFIVTRVYTNNSGGNVTIEEIGLVDTAQGSWRFLIVRDNLASSVTMADGETLTLNYTFATTI